MLNLHSEIKGHVLFIEESDSFTALMMLYFTENSLSFEHFKNVDDALAAYSCDQSGFDLIIIDVSKNNGSSGLALIKGVQQLHRTRRSPPVLAVSETIDDKKKSELLSAGCNDFLAMPFLVEELAARAGSLIINKQLLDKVDVQQESLNSLSLIDKLTSLHNQHYLIDLGERLTSLSKRQKIPLSLIKISIDHQKQLHESFGHQSWDTILQCTGVLINCTSRQEDITARCIDDEFAILLSYCDKKDALDKAERLKEAILKLNPDNIEITASMGVASVSNGETCEWDVLLSTADAGLNQARQQGGNCVQAVVLAA